MFLQGNHVDLVGSASDPWVIGATLVMVDGSDPRATLVTVAEEPMNQGWANFTDVAVTHAGSYALNFTVVYPAGARGRFFGQSAEFEIATRDIEIEITYQPDTVLVNEEFGLEARLYDKNTQEIITDLGWKVCQQSGIFWLSALCSELPTIDGFLCPILHCSFCLYNYKCVQFTNVYVLFRMTRGFLQ